MNYEKMTKAELIKRLKFLESGIENVKRKEIDPELRKSEEKTLEQCVLDRTNELSNTNKDLLKEIAEREQTEDKTRQYEHIVSCSTDMLAFIDKRFEYIAVNRAYSEAFKKKPEELIGHTVSEVFGEEFFNTVIKSNAERALAGKEVHYQEWFKFPAYERRYMGIVYYPYFDENNKVMGFVVNGRNITERKKADGLLREKEQQMRLFMLSTNDCIWNWDMVTNTVERSLGFERALGYMADEIRPGIEWWADRLHPNDKERVWKTFNDAVAGRQLACGYEYRFRCRDGSYISIEDIACLIRDDTGKVVRAIGAMRDITGRKQDEEALKASEHKYRSLFDNMLNGFAYCKIIVDENNKPIDFEYLEVNDAFEKLTGLKKDDIIGKKVTEAIPAIKDKNPELFDIYGKVALTGEGTQFDIYLGPLEMWFFISVYSPQKGYFVAIFDNITERKKAEELLKGQKKALEQKNIALSEVLGQIEIEKKQIKDNVIANAENLLLPIIQKLRLKGESRKYVQLLRKNLQELTSSFGAKVSDKATKLTHKEIELCNMIKNGLANKEMAKLLNISLATVEKHRNNIRRKLNIVNKDVNLSSVLKTL